MNQGETPRSLLGGGNPIRAAHQGAQMPDPKVPDFGGGRKFRVLPEPPLSPDDPRREAWFQIDRLLWERHNAADAELLRQARTAPLDQMLPLFLAWACERYDEQARLLVVATTNYEVADQSIEVLEDAAREWNKRSFEFIRPEGFVGCERWQVHRELKTRIDERLMHWRAELLRKAREVVTSRDSPTIESPKPSKRPVTAAVILQRNKLIADFRSARDLSVVAFARKVGISETAIRGIVREDKNRFSEATQARFLAFLGLSVQDWYRE